MRLVYTTLLYLLTPFVLLRFVVRGFRAPYHWQRWGERFGLFEAPEPRPTIWIHAVSVGETQAAVPLVRELFRRYPDHRIAVTTTTPTGSERVRQLFGDQVFHVYFPFDLPGSVRRFLDRLRPELALIMEVELWPNLYRICCARGIPILLANARLSARSAGQYQRVARLTRSMLRCVQAVAAQGQGDAERFIRLGADPQRVRVTGNTKFDLWSPPSLREQAAVLRREWGVDRPVWIAASTHEGEDERVLAAHERVRRALPAALLVLVPRHPERFSAVTHLVRQTGFTVVTRTSGEACTAETAVFVGDTMGELPLFYAASDAAFVAGSLVSRVGGHNPLEPADLGLPVAFGPWMFNFSDISRLLLEAGAAREVTTVEELADTLVEWLTNGDLRHEMGQKGAAVVQKNRGARDAVLEMVEALLRNDTGK